MEIDRSDGRTPNQLRPLSCSRNVLNRAHGSASWSQGINLSFCSIIVFSMGTLFCFACQFTLFNKFVISDYSIYAKSLFFFSIEHFICSNYYSLFVSIGDTKVLAAVYGPKAGTKKNENPEKACFEVIWKQKTGQSGRSLTLYYSLSTYILHFYAYILYCYACFRTNRFFNLHFDRNMLSHLSILFLCIIRVRCPLEILDQHSFVRSDLLLPIFFLSSFKQKKNISFPMLS